MARVRLFGLFGLWRMMSEEARGLGGLRLLRFEQLPEARNPGMIIDFGRWATRKSVRNPTTCKMISTS